jgi:hypothetical protein
MKNMLRQTGFVTALLFFPLAAVLAQQVPPGTVLPIMASNTLDSAKSKPGDRLTGRLMQDVRLPSGERLRAGAKVEGWVTKSTNSAGSTGARVAVRFDRLVFRDKQISITASLRALASMQEVFDAQLPWNAFDDYGTSSSDWSTVQVGGAAVYRGDGTVRSAMEIVGKTTDSGAVSARLMPASKQGCPDDPANDESEQSLWVFSPWACGAYGFDDLTIQHHGATPPMGIIELRAQAPFRVKGGSAWLLRVVASGAGVPSTASR